jgi:hypothetical protein
VIFFHCSIFAPDFIGDFGARFPLLPERIDLIQKPSRGDILSDVCPTADGEGSDLGETLFGWEAGDCLLAAAKRTPPPLWRAAKLFTTSLRTALGARFVRS